jgi:hypothetical protein
MKPLQAAALCAFALALAAPAHGNDAYWTNKDGKIITSEKTGLCIRTTRWTESKADPQCLEKFKKTQVATTRR